jgi:hypothetical protein
MRVVGCKAAKVAERGFDNHLLVLTVAVLDRQLLFFKNRLACLLHKKSARRTRA